MDRHADGGAKATSSGEGKRTMMRTEARRMPLRERQNAKSNSSLLKIMNDQSGGGDQYAKSL
jgi:hypothetical protein